MQRAPGLPCALCCQGGTTLTQASGAPRREKADVCPYTHRHARAGGHPVRPRLIGSSTGASGILDRPPEPVIGRTFGRPDVGRRQRRVSLKLKSTTNTAVVPDKRAAASADPGPITPARGFAESVCHRDVIERSRGMGPGFRRDETEDVSRTNPLAPTQRSLLTQIRHWRTSI